MTTPAPNEIPKPPNKPDPMECCRRGCYPCIFDYYDTAMTRWEERIRKLGLEPDAVLAGLEQG